MDRKMLDLAEHFSALTIKKQMHVVAHKAARSGIYFKETLEEFEKTLLQALLERYDYNVTRVAVKVKMHRNTITQKMKRYHLTAPDSEGTDLPEKKGSSTKQAVS